jgi:hypothetical protein
MINMNENLTDPSCVDGGLNPTLFPVGTAQHLDINYNIIPFLCDLLKATTDPNATGILVPPPASGFDITPFTDFTTLTAIGDPRVSLGETLIQSFITFLPKIIVQSEVRQNGGTQVIDNYICTSDGTQIKKTETFPILLSLDLTGQRSYQYGAITIPPVTTSFDELMQPLIPEHVDEFVNDYIADRKTLHANAFVSFINKYYTGWTRSIGLYNASTKLIVLLEKGTEKVYLKYYPDVVNEVAKSLSLTQINQMIGNTSPTNLALSNSLTSIIPDYVEVMSNVQNSNEHYNDVMSKYKTTPDLEYTNILANSALAMSYFSSLFNNTATVNPIPVS